MLSLAPVLGFFRRVFAGRPSPLEGSVLDLELVGNDGQKVPMSAFRGKKLLIVNTASKCGYTYQLQQLQILHETYRHKVQVLGFPSNDFWQERGNDSEIASFCLTNYGVTFPIFQKTSVVGRNMHPLFRILLRLSGRTPQWNFCKYLLDEDGKFIAFFTSKVNPLDKKIIAKL